MRVDEPTAAGLGTVSSPNQPTNYQYDVLGNLCKVTQGQQQRFFMYDSLSRLRRARNPEQMANSALNISDSISGNSQWTMSYEYDNNGNLTSRVDARGVTATYAYDALNRNKTVVYTNDVASTPTVSRYYDGWRDGNSNSSITNSKGRLWQTETSGSLRTRVTIDGYDAVGHPQQQEQNFYSSSGWSPSYTVGRTYDLAGHVLTQTYPSGHAVSYNYDQAGRLADKDAQNLAFTGNLGDGVSRTYVSGLSYDEAGRMIEEKYGTLTPLYHKQHFNVRGQLYDIRLGTAPWATDQWSWDRGAIINYYSYQNFTRGYSGTDNNGNLTRSENWIPGSDYFQDRYTYDELNRLKSVTEFQNGSSTSFAQTYKYDMWGNRTIDLQNNATWGNQINALQTTADANTNRMYAPNDTGHSLIDYDAAGNQTRDYLTGNGLRTYDAENRLLTATSGTASTYTYDGDGRRVRRNLAGAEMWQIYGLDGELLAEYSAGAASFVPHEEYGYRNGQLLITATSGDEQRVERFITNFYYAALGRAPSAEELSQKRTARVQAGAQGQTQLVTAAITLGQVLFDFGNSSSEYNQRQRTDTQFVTDLYFAYLQRAPDNGGLEYYVGQLQQPGFSRATVRDGFGSTADTEFVALASRIYGTNNGNLPDRVAHYLSNMYLGAIGNEGSLIEAKLPGLYENLMTVLSDGPRR